METLLLSQKQTKAIFSPRFYPPNFPVNKLQFKIIAKGNEDIGFDSVAIRGTLQPIKPRELSVIKCTLEAIPDKTEEEGYDVYKNTELVFIIPKSKLCNEPEEIQWVTKAEVSSTYGDGWGPLDLLGPPRVFPSHGDIKGAWAPKTSKGTNEWLLVHYDKPMHVSGIYIFETNNPGYVNKVSVLSIEDNNWIEVWSIPAITPAEKVARAFYIPFDRPTPFTTQSIRVDIDCMTAPSWVEIDCVAMRGYLTIPKQEIRNEPKPEKEPEQEIRSEPRPEKEPEQEIRSEPRPEKEPEQEIRSEPRPEKEPEQISDPNTNPDSQPNKS